jgi:hypothetical protein
MAWIRAIVKWLNPQRRLIALAMVGWVVLVIVGAGRAPNSDEWVSVPDLGGLFVLSAAAATIVGIVLMIVLRPTTKTARGPGRQRSRRLPTLAVLAFVLVLIAFAPKQDEPDQAAAEPPPPVATEENAVGTLPDDTAEGASTGDMIGLLAVGTLAAGVLVYSARRGSPANSDGGYHAEADLATAVGPAIESATERLKLGGEPQAAVIAAYAGLEKTLAEHGQRRRPAETPTEHMARALAEFPALADPAVQLGALYEVARFSDHPVGEADRRRALAALEEARGAFTAMGTHA